MSARRIGFGLVAQVYSNAVTIIVQLASVPLFLWGWGNEHYGVWLVITAIPSYLTLADFGFAQVAASEMTMRAAAGDRAGAVRVFHAGLRLFLWVASAVSALFLVWSLTTSFFEFSSIRGVGRGELILTMAALVAQIVLGIFFGLIGGALRSTGQFGWLVSTLATSRLIESGAAVAVALAGGGFVLAASLPLVAKSVALVVAIKRLKTLAPWYDFVWISDCKNDLRKLLAPSLTFLAFTLGALLNIQGITIVVAWLFGPTAVVTVNTIRTFSRFGVQMANIVNYTWQPEYSMAFGAANGSPKIIKKFMTIHFSIVAALASGFLAFGFIGGHEIIALWTRGAVSAPAQLLSLMIIGATLEMIWMALQTPLIATNRHSASSIWYVCVSVIGLTFLTACERFLSLDSIGLYALANAALMLVITLAGVVRFSQPRAKSEETILHRSGKIRA